MGRGVWPVDWARCCVARRRRGGAAEPEGGGGAGGGTRGTPGGRSCGDAARGGRMMAGAAELLYSTSCTLTSGVSDEFDTERSLTHCD